MLRRSFVVLSVVSLLFTAGLAQATVTYTLTDLGNLGYSATSVTQIATVGGNLVVCGSGQTTSALVYDGWYWTQATGMVNLKTTLTGYNAAYASSYASGVNASGKIVGTLTDTSSTTYGYVYTLGGGVSAVNPPNGYWYGTGTVNSSGQVAGFYSLGIDPTNRAAISSVSGAAGTAIGTSLAANAINDNGWVAAYGTNTGTTTDAWVWNGSTWTDVGTISGRATRTIGINNNADVVGYSPNSSNKRAPFYVHYNGAGWDSMVNLFAAGSNSSGTLVAGTASGVNDSGTVIGYEYVTSLPSQATAYVWPNHTAASAVQLSTLVTNLNGWTLQEALAIDNAGHIAGVGLDSSGNAKAYLLTPVPEPSTLLLSGLGLVGLIAYAWRKRK